MLKPEQIEKLAFTEAPIVLRGTPEHLVGVAELQNENDDEVLLRKLEVATKGKLSRQALLTRKLGLTRSIPPKRCCKVPLRAAVDSRTPPGEYEVELSTGAGAPKTAVLKVLPVERVQIYDNKLHLEAGPGATVMASVCIGNDGNVPVVLDTIGLVVLQEPDQICVSLQRSLAAAEGKDHHRFLDTFVRQLSEKRVDVVRVRTCGGAVSLPPGEVECVPLDFRFPANLKRGRRYIGSLSILGQGLRVQVNTVGQPGDGEERRRKKR
ncbi:MAG TPA: hypothetical protein ENJ19_06125 [Gammaproteobacteria bacterium]|nr:hypothetical protein [Gammaproteobacteria bacterium]